MALNYCAPGRQEGVDILFSSAYSGNKTVLLQGIEDVTRAAETALQEHEDHKEDHESLARDLPETSHFFLFQALPAGILGGFAGICARSLRRAADHEHLFDRGR